MTKVSVIAGHLSICNRGTMEVRVERSKRRDQLQKSWCICTNISPQGHKSGTAGTQWITGMEEVRLAQWAGPCAFQRDRDRDGDR